MPRFRLSLNGQDFSTDDLRSAQSFLRAPESCIPTLAGVITDKMRAGFWETLVEAERTRNKINHVVDGLSVTVSSYF